MKVIVKALVNDKKQIKEEGTVSLNTCTKIQELFKTHKNTVTYTILNMCVYKEPNYARLSCFKK